MSLIFDSNANGIHGLFHIPDEMSYIKKLILSNSTVYNPEIIVAFKIVQEKYDNVKLVHKDNYFALLLPTESQGVQLEAMLITTVDEEGNKLFSIYHRLHFDPKYFPIALIESDAFLALANIVVNVPLSSARGKSGVEGITALLNYQINEALNIEITMLTLADANVQMLHDYVETYIYNSVYRYMLASHLDNLEYHLDFKRDEVAALIAKYCDVALLDVAIGLEKIDNLEEILIRCEDTFLAEFASGVVGMMFLYLEAKTSEALLDEGGFASVKNFFQKNSAFYALQSLDGMGERLGTFTQLQL